MLNYFANDLEEIWNNKCDMERLFSTLRKIVPEIEEFMPAIQSSFNIMQDIHSIIDRFEGCEDTSMSLERQCDL